MSDLLTFDEYAANSRLIVHDQYSEVKTIWIDISNDPVDDAI